MVRPNKRSREKEDSTLEGESSRKKVKLADRQQIQDGKKGSKEDRLQEFTRIMSKKRTNQADWVADVGVNLEGSNFTNKPKEESEANDQKSSRANGAHSDGTSPQGNTEEIISDTEWMRRRMGGVEIDQKAFEQSDDEDELTKPETIQVYPHCSFQHNLLILILRHNLRRYVIKISYTRLLRPRVDYSFATSSSLVLKTNSADALKNTALLTR